MLDLADNPSFQEAQDNALMESVKSSRRGRKAVPQSWSRVIDTQTFDLEQTAGFEIDQDIMDMDEEPLKPPRKTRKQWKPYFHPNTYWQEHQFHGLEDNVLGYRALKLHAKTISMKRQVFLDRAKAAVQRNKDLLNDAQRSTAELNKKLQNRGTGVKAAPNEIKPSEFKEPTGILKRRKGKHRPKLTAREKVRIVHRVIHQHHFEKDVAKEYRISQQRVNYLCQKAKKNPMFLAEIASEEERKNNVY